MSFTFSIAKEACLNMECVKAEVVWALYMSMGGGVDQLFLSTHYTACKYYYSVHVYSQMVDTENY